MFHDVGQAPEYFGPPRPGQTFSEYESFMKAQWAAAAGGAAVGALLLGPIGAVALGVGAWLATPRLATHQKPKSQTQGG